MDTEKKRNGRAAILNNKVVTTALILAIMVIIAILFAPNFLSAYNMSSVFRDLAFIGMIAIAQSCLLLLGELDLSCIKEIYAFFKSISKYFCGIF